MGMPKLWFRASDPAAQAKAEAAAREEFLATGVPHKAIRDGELWRAVQA